MDETDSTSTANKSIVYVSKMLWSEHGSEYAKRCKFEFSRLFAYTNYSLFPEICQIVSN